SPARTACARITKTRSTASMTLTTAADIVSVAMTKPSLECRHSWSKSDRRTADRHTTTDVKHLPGDKTRGKEISDSVSHLLRPPHSPQRYAFNDLSRRWAIRRIGSLESLGPNGPRCHTIHRDVIGRQLQRHGASHADDARLACRIGR